MTIDKKEDLNKGKFGGMKCDLNKTRWDLLPFNAVKQVADIMTYGAAKYEPDNWKKVEPERYFAAMIRHLEAYQRGELYDDESGFLHISHAACNAIFLVWKSLNKGDKGRIDPEK